MTAASSAALSLPGTSGHLAVLRAMARKIRRLWWLLLPVAGATGLATMSGSTTVVVAVFCGSAAVCLQFLWWGTATALTGQNHPLAAHLVPGQARQLREVALGVFLGLAMLSGLLMHVVMEHFLAWTIASAAAMTLFAGALRWPVLWFLMWIVPAFGAPALRNTAAGAMLVDAMVDWHVRQPLVQTALVMLVLCAVLWRVFQDGGPAHAHRWARVSRMRAMMSMQSSGRAALPEGRMASAFSSVFYWGRPLWRDHLLRNARPTPASAMARAEFAALRGLHWSSSGASALMVLGLLLAAEAAVLFGLAPGRAEQVLQGALPGVGLGMMCSLLGPSLGIAMSLHQTRREQGLLLLLPGVPRGAMLNRMLARRQMATFLMVWGVGVVAITLLISLTPGGWASTLPQTGLHFAAASLPFGLLVWRDWSRQGLPSGQHVALLTLAVILLMGAITGLGVLLKVSAWTMLGVSALVTAALAAWRWRVVTRMVPFWPVGRHA